MKQINEMKVKSLQSLETEGFKVAFIKGNRDIVAKNVQNKKDSFEDFKCNIIPILYVLGSKAVEDGCELEDVEHNPIKDGLDKVVAIVDGQHRYTAAVKNGLDKGSIAFLEDYSEASTKKLIAGANCDSFTWNTKDYVSGAALMNPENEVAIFAKKLVDRKFSISTIGWILFFEGGKLSKKDFALLMEGKDIRKADLYDLERANAFLDAAGKHFEDKYLVKHYLIEGVCRISKEYGYKRVINVVNGFSADEVERMRTANSDNAIKVVVNVLKSHLQDE